MLAPEKGDNIKCKMIRLELHGLQSLGETAETSEANKFWERKL